MFSFNQHLNIHAMFELASDVEFEVFCQELYGARFRLFTGETLSRVTFS